MFHNNNCVFVFYLADKTKALKRKADNVTEDPADNLDSKPEKVSCPHCTSELSSQKNLKRHIRDVHCLDIAPMICIEMGFMSHQSMTTALFCRCM